MKKNASHLMAILLILINPGITKGQTYSRNGMVVSSSEVASNVGMEILMKGGNVIDASVATAFALAVTYPSAGNIGGGGFLVYMNAQGETTSIDFRETAPAAASEDMFIDETGALIRGKNKGGNEVTANHLGLRSVGVPGTVAGLFMAHQKYGRLPWSDLIQPAIDLASDGIKLTWNLFRYAKFFRENSEIEFLRDYFNNEEGELTQFGERWEQPVLAETLKQIRDNGRDGFYKGTVAKEIVDYMKENGGLINLEDLDNYQAIERKPITTTYKDYVIHSMPPPSSGGVALIEMMNLIELVDIDSIEFNSTAYVHLLAEVMRRAFADRAEHIGDPEFNPDMPIKRLVSKQFAKERVAGIDMNRASPSDSSRFGQIYDSDNTTHFSVMDQDGNAVSLTYTLEGAYGCGMGSPELGFFFNNEMGDFNPVPGITNNKGLIGTKPNNIEPGKRMLSNMTPTIVAKDDRPVLVIGSPGGRTIINSVFQTVLAVLEYDMRIDRAIESMKIHHQWLPDRIIYERHQLSPDTKLQLQEMGHELVPRPFIGRLMGIQWEEENKILIGAADSSSPDGGAKGY